MEFIKKGILSETIQVLNIFLVPYNESEK